MKIDCANKRNISNSPDVPDVSAGIQMWFQPIRIDVVFKQNRGGYLQEFINTFRNQAFKIAQSPQQLMMKPEGQRDWKWHTLYMNGEPKLKVDDIIVIQNMKYRVMQKRDNSEYSCVEYELLEDYQDED